MAPLRRKREWFDNDDFWRDLYSFMFPETRFAAAVDEAGKVLRLAHPRGRKVLDLCCGPGRFSIALAKRGYKVTGVDRTPYLLAKARAGAKKARVNVEWIRRDMRDFVRPNAFDLAINMFTSFGYFEDKREDLRVLERVLESLRPGGALLIELMGKERLARIYVPVKVDTLPDGAVLVQRHAILKGWTRIRNDWTLIRGGRTKTFRFEHTIYSAQELRERLERAGFTEVKVYGSVAGEEYGFDSARLVVVGRKSRR